MEFRWFLLWAGIAIAVGINPPGLAQTSPAAVEQIAQSRAPRLLGAWTTADGVWLRYARYYFTIELPPTALNPVQKIQLQQRTGTEQIDLRSETAFAFLGTSRRQGDAIALAAIAADPDTATLTLTLERPIQPGETVTIGVRPDRNPRYGGEYGFGVTVYPTAAATTGLYLGPGRLHFYERDRDFPW